MTAPQRFAFDDDFGAERRGSASFRRAADLQRLKEAEEEGFARGRAEGRHETEREASMRLAEAMETVAASAAAVIATLEAEARRFEREAVQLAAIFARKLAGDLLAREPLAPLEATVEECFRELVGVPHLAVRVPAEHVGAVKERLDQLAEERGFAGRIVVLGEDGMGHGDFRIEWADGGIVRDIAAIESLIGEAAARHSLSL